jgi:hypothetical protein
MYPQPATRLYRVYGEKGRFIAEAAELAYFVTSR